jgi:hypothetical protein
LDGADATTLTLSGTNITQWNDKSGNGRNGTVAGTIGYDFVLNNRQATSWTQTAAGIGTYIRGSISVTTSTMTVFSTFVMNSSSYVAARILGLSAPGAVDYNNASYTAPIARLTTTAYGAYRNSTSLSSTTFTSGAAVVVCSQYTGSSNIFYVNGVGSTPVATTGAFNISQYELGNSTTEESLVWLNGSIGEVIIYTNSLSSNERQAVEGYLAWKWGLQGNLSTTHPYKTTRP